jgi:hypothetical protein
MNKFLVFIEPENSLQSSGKPAPDPFASQFNPVNILSYDFPKFSFTTITASTSRIRKRSLPSRYYKKHFARFLDYFSNYKKFILVFFTKT